MDSNLAVKLTGADSAFAFNELHFYGGTGFTDSFNCNYFNGI